MRIGITGATGFIGSHLASAAHAAGHEVVGFSRQRITARTEAAEWRQLSPDHPPDLSGLDAIVHLAGASVASLWTRKRKEVILRSRVDPTRAIVTALESMGDAAPPLFCASAVGFYGDGGDHELAESSPAGKGFLADVVRAWEAEVSALPDSVRACRLRFGVVLGKDGGMFPLLRRVFALGLGGRLGSGRQWMPWVHIDDVTGLILHAIRSGEARGPINVTAPTPATNAHFTRALARHLHRPAFFHAPAPLLRLVARGQASMFLDSQRALPRAAEALGYEWRHPTLESALPSLC